MHNPASLNSQPTFINTFVPAIIYFHLCFGGNSAMLQFPNVRAHLVNLT